ncbi:hypothetical protein GCM10027422_18660 [Hymenobacter arcticus]
MLDFYFIHDAQPNCSSPRQLAYAGGIREEEFELAQQLGLIESYADYYGKFRWSSKQVQQKRAMITLAVESTISNLAPILKQAFAAEQGVVAFGD